MTTVAIMQPYFFPYIGYYQLIARSDVFVVYDDAQYIRSGWSNRNRILRDGVPHFLTFPVDKAHYELTYRERHYQATPENRQRILRSVSEAYKRAPQFGAVMPIIEDIMAFPDSEVAAFNRNLIERTSDYLGIATPIVLSSAVDKPQGLSGQDRVIAICKALGATRYVNAIGGVALYDRDRFEKEGIELFFNRTKTIAYPQGGGEPVANLSIIDVMMYNPREAAAAMLDEYDLV